MSNLIVLDFDGIHTADEVLNKLRSLQKEHLIDLEDACVVERDKDGKVHIKQAVNLTALGGDIMARFDDVGYFRARLPLKQFAKAKAAPGVLMALIAGDAVWTGSKWADEILDNWDRRREQFWQVCPKEMLARLAHPLDDVAAEVAAAE